ncbi:MAG: ATP-dependent helicase [Saprospiraceae bacterium]|nr:ATP-dependent helicase [Saprospiraceae bacterium]
MENYSIAINWELQQELNVWLPAPIIVTCDSSGQLLYFDRECNEHTRNSYIRFAKDPHFEDIYILCQEIKLDSILEKFCKKGKLKNPFDKILKDEILKNQVYKYLDQKKSIIFEKLISTEIPSVLQAQRKIHLQNNLLSTTSIIPEVYLHFAKTEEGLEYKLQLYIDKKIIIPCQNDILLINNKPAWIILNKTIYPLNKLNANKISPFLKKEIITIPKKLTRAYFEKFISELLSVAEIEVDGYKLIYQSTIHKALLVPAFDFILQKWMLELVFDYGLIRFNNADLRIAKNIIRTISDEEIEVTRIERNRDQERIFIKKLNALGLICEPNQRFYLNDEDPWSVCLLLADQRDVLIKDFEISEFNFEDKKIIFTPASISVESKIHSDWFDIFGVIYIGDHTLPFSSLIKNLKRNERLFLLPDGLHFIIPQEWFTRFDILIKFGEVEDEKIKVPKSHLDRFKETELDQKPIPFSLNLSNRLEKFEIPKELKAELRAYQRIGYEWLAKHHADGLGACLADDMGLGKTLQTIAVILHSKNLKNINKKILKPQSGIPRDLFSEEEIIERSDFSSLIVLPSSLVFNWAEEFQKFAPSLHILQHVGTERASNIIPFENYDVILTSYAILMRDIQLFKQKEFDYIILDESQQIKNRDSKIFRLLHSLRSINRISLSGTPVENSLSDLWSQMEFINPKILGSFEFFNNHYIKPIKNLKDGAALSELKEIIKPYLLRRTKEQVAPDLPALTEQIFFSQMSEVQAKKYEEEKSAARNAIFQLDYKDQKSRFVILTSLLRLRQIANHPCLVSSENTKDDSGKFDDVCSQIQTLYHAKHKVLIFSSFTSHLEIYKNWLIKQKMTFVLLTGETLTADRQKIIHQFQNDEDTLIFLLSLKAGGTGLNLTAAEYVFILDPWWNPFVEKQAVARAHRIGQNRPVQLIRFISKNTIEEKIHQLQTNKLQLAEEIISDTDIPSWLSDNLKELVV